MSTMNFRINRLRAALSASSASLALLLSGCGLGSSATSADTVNVAFSGNVHGGQQPVTQSHIALFATTSAGYNGTLTPLATAMTDGSGNFQILGSYNCPAGQQAYIVSTGGNPGILPVADNSAIFAVAALGPCTSIKSGTFVVINEVTTVAAAYALSGFFPVGGAGMTEAAVIAGTAMPGVTTSSTNTQGLTDAFLNAANIVSYGAGTAYAVTPSNTTGTVPQATINALGDILQDCVNSSLPTSTACTNLFTAAKPPAASGIAAPVNIFQAALDIAQYPGNNVGTLFGYISAQAAFPTTLSSAPNDWSLGITYTNSLLTSAAGLGIDSNDNVYLTGLASIIEFGPQGQAPTGNLASNLAAKDTLRNVAFDLNNTLFSTDDTVGGIWQYTQGATTATQRLFSVAPATDPNPNSYGIAVDKQGDVFTESYSKAKCATAATECALIEYPATATAAPTAYPAYTPFSLFPATVGSAGVYKATQPTGGYGGGRAVAFDVNTGNVWMSDIDDASVSLFTVTPGTSGVATANNNSTSITTLGTQGGAAGAFQVGSLGIAIDKTSNAWVVITGGASTSPTVIAAALYPVSSAGVVGTAVTGGGLTTPYQVAVDGNNNLFVANSGGNSIVVYSPAQSAFISPATGIAPSSTGILYKPQYIAVDKSGAVWTFSTGAYVAAPTMTTPNQADLVQILGVAAPVNPVLAAGQYGVKP